MQEASDQQELVDCLLDRGRRYLKERACITLEVDLENLSYLWDTYYKKLCSLFNNQHINSTFHKNGISPQDLKKSTAQSFDHHECHHQNGDDVYDTATNQSLNESFQSENGSLKLEDLVDNSSTTKGRGLKLEDLDKEKACNGSYHIHDECLKYHQDDTDNPNTLNGSYQSLNGSNSSHNGSYRLYDECLKYQQGDTNKHLDFINEFGGSLASKYKNDCLTYRPNNTSGLYKVGQSRPLPIEDKEIGRTSPLLPSKESTSPSSSQKWKQLSAGRVNKYCSACAARKNDPEASPRGHRKFGDQQSNNHRLNLSHSLDTSFDRSSTGSSSPIPIRRNSASGRVSPASPSPNGIYSPVFPRKSFSTGRRSPILRSGIRSEPTSPNLHTSFT